jgi:hypothetical protein
MHRGRRTTLQKIRKLIAATPAARTDSLEALRLRVRQLSSSAVLRLFAL